MEQQIEVPGDWTSIATLLTFCDHLEASFDLTAAQRYLLRLVIEEIATNIVKYGYHDANRGMIELRCVQYDQQLLITMRDRGTPFDPRDHPDPADPEGLSLDERNVGGLGLFFVRELSDELTYHHDPISGWNELIVRKGPDQ
ncbi:MAG: ATP-binding protein [Oscillochloridaceae bacterium umkhey_bin13]